MVPPGQYPDRRTVIEGRTGTSVNTNGWSLGPGSTEGGTLRSPGASPIDNSEARFGKGNEVVSFVQVSHTERCLPKLSSFASFCETHAMFERDGHKAELLAEVGWLFMTMSGRGPSIRRDGKEHGSLHLE